MSNLKITLTVDWSAGPFSVSGDPEGVRGIWDVDDISEVLPLSDALLVDIDSWNNCFQDTFNSDDPAESGFKTEEEERRFNDAGRELARRIRAEAPEGVKVYYSPIWDYKTEEIGC